MIAIFILLLTLLVVRPQSDSNGIWSVEALNPGRMFLLDSNAATRTFLFRGNFPGTHDHKHVNFTGLVDVMREKAIVAGTEIPKGKVFVVDLSLLVPIQKEYFMETDFFDASPDLGRVMNWMLVGAYINASKLSDSEIKKRVSHEFGVIDLDKLVTRIPEMNKMVNSDLRPNPTYAATAIYAHCTGGVDRTGELSAAYLMDYKNWSFPSAIYFDDHVRSSSIATGNSQMSEWWCWYLVYVKGKDPAILKCGEWPKP